MPDIVAHNAMGKSVLSQLEPEISNLIDYDVFCFSVMGPDPYIFYRFFAPRFRHGINKRSAIMHETKTKEFLVELAKRSQSREVFSFLAGFLCHYALDSTAHPFINEAANFRGQMHVAIEHRLDVLELNRQGKQRRDIMELFSADPGLTEVKAVLKKVYGWDDDYFRISYHHMKLYHWFAKDQHGLLLFLLEKTKKSRVCHSYQNRLADGIDLSPFNKLEEDAVELGIRLITSAYRFRAKQIEEEELVRILGSKSYSGEDIITF